MVLAVGIVVHRVGGKNVHLVLTISVVVSKWADRSVDRNLIVIDSQSADLSIEAGKCKRSSAVYALFTAKSTGTN